jgi:DNA processing protein
MSTLFSSSFNYQSIDSKVLLAILVDQIGLTPARYLQIFGFYKSLADALEGEFGMMKHLKLKWLDRINQTLESLPTKLIDLQKALETNQIKILDFESPDYPTSLKILENYPLILYTQGDVKQLANKMLITIVGSRIIDPYTEILSKQIVTPLCKLGVGVVSGLAVGMDGLAHQISLENKAITVGVIGSGLDQRSFYPSQNWAMKNQIIQSGGCVISEYAPGRLPNTYTFPQRNRLLAALTDLTFVVQASSKSGSLITALKARDLGKTLCTIPADIRNKNFDGNLKLMKEGCEIITESEDILSLMALKMHPEIQIKETKQFGSKDEEKVYNTLSIQALNIDKISDLSGIDTTMVSVALTMLELSGLAMNTGENNWIKAG